MNFTALAVSLTVWFVFSLILGIAVGRLLDGSSSDQEDVLPARRSAGVSPALGARPTPAPHRSERPRITKRPQRGACTTLVAASLASLLFLCLILCGTGCRPELPAELVIVNGTEPESLDPAIVTGVSEMRLTKALFEGLLRLDGETARPIPALAQRWDVSADRKAYTFHLRTNALWSTGEPITGDDVVYSWIRALRTETSADYAGQLFYIRKAEAFCTGKLKDASQVGVRARLNSLPAR